MEEVKQFNILDMVRNPDRMAQLIVYNGMQFGLMKKDKTTYPTNFDSVIDYKRLGWVYYEVKTGDAPLPLGQRIALENAVQDATVAGKGCIAMVVEHTVFDTKKPVELANCMVREYKIGFGDWHRPERPYTVLEMSQKFIEMIDRSREAIQRRCKAMRAIYRSFSIEELEELIDERKTHGSIVRRAGNDYQHIS